MTTPQDPTVSMSEAVEWARRFVADCAERENGCPPNVVSGDAMLEICTALLSSSARVEELEGAFLTADQVMAEIEAVASEPVKKALRLCYDGKGRDPANEKGKIADVALRDLALEPVTLYRRRVPREEAPIYARRTLEGHHGS